MDFGLKDKRVLITGASRGIGAAAARAFAGEGARLALHYGRELAEIETIPHEVALKGEFTDPRSVRDVVGRAVDVLGGLDVLINNAGHMLGRHPVGEIDEQTLRAVFDLNATSIVVASQAAVPALADSGGNIVNVTSISARTGGGVGSSLYSAAKAYVSSFTRSSANELAAKGIRVNAVAPGTIMTRFHEIYSTPEKLAATAKAIPMGRIGTAEDCAGAFLFLASDRLAGYVTGQILEVNGGQLMP